MLQLAIFDHTFSYLTIRIKRLRKKIVSLIISFVSLIAFPVVILVKAVICHVKLRCHKVPNHYNGQATAMLSPRRTYNNWRSVENIQNKGMHRKSTLYQSLYISYSTSWEKMFMGCVALVRRLVKIKKVKLKVPKYLFHSRRFGFSPSSME